jgi:hypothetical protein
MDQMTQSIACLAAAAAAAVAVTAQWVIAP